MPQHLLTEYSLLYIGFLQAQIKHNPLPQTTTDATFFDLCNGLVEVN